MAYKKSLLISSIIILVLAASIGMLYVFYPHEYLPSPQRPYFLKLDDFRYYPDAVEAKKRLTSYPAFVMPMKTDLGVWFRVGVGPTSKETQAREWQNKLIGEGITTEFEQYSDIKEVMVENPKLIIKENKSWVNDIESKPMPSALQPMKQEINYVPYNKQFRIVECAIANSKHIKKNEDYHLLLPFFNTNDYSFSNYLSKEDIVEMFDRFVFVNYLDPLSKSGISVFIGYMSKRLNINELIDKVVGDSITRTTIEISTGDQTLKGYSVEPKGKEIIYVLHNDTYFVFADTDTDKQTIESFLSTINKTKGLFQYIPIRDQLFSSIPVSTEDTEFVYFYMEEIGEDYVIEKDYAAWAKRMKGYWSSVTVLHLNNGPLTVSLFDLLGDDYTSKTYGLFSKEKRMGLQNPYSKLLLKFAEIYVVPIPIKGHKGWYVDSPDDMWGRSKEISFSVKHYIVAVDSYQLSGHILMRKSLESVANSLQVF
ncbi:SPOR domain-containing protein [Caldisericum sp.]|uniref:SPOR domain-containing protein n=1 Tax=Caldisericum sp. TaxID=2499687 RepID=UPI003C9C1932